MISRSSPHRLVGAAHVLVSDADGLRLDLGGLAPADTEDPAGTTHAACTHLAIAQVPDATDDREGQQVAQQQAAQRARRLGHGVLHLGSIKFVDQLRVAAGGYRYSREWYLFGTRRRVGVLHGAYDALLAQGHAGDLPSIDLGLELAVWNLGLLDHHRSEDEVLEEPHADQRTHNVADQEAQLPLAQRLLVLLFVLVVLFRWRLWRTHCLPLTASLTRDARSSPTAAIPASCSSSAAALPRSPPPLSDTACLALPQAGRTGCTASAARCTC